MSPAMIAYRNGKGFQTRQWRGLRAKPKVLNTKPRWKWGMCTKRTDYKSAKCSGRITVHAEENLITPCHSIYVHGRLLPSQGEGAMRAWAHPSSFLHQRIKLPLCFLKLSFVLLVRKALGLGSRFGRISNSFSASAFQHQGSSLKQWWRF